MSAILIYSVCRIIFNVNHQVRIIQVRSKLILNSWGRNCENTPTLAFKNNFIYFTLQRVFFVVFFRYWIYIQMQTICEQSIHTVGYMLDRAVWKGFLATLTKSFLSKQWINTHPPLGQTWQWLKCARKTNKGRPNNVLFFFCCFLYFGGASRHQDMGPLVDLTAICVLWCCHWLMQAVHKGWH